MLTALCPWIVKALEEPPADIVMSITSNTDGTQDGILLKTCHLLNCSTVDINHQIMTYDDVVTCDYSKVPIP